MTNHWVDIGNTDCVLLIGSNAAENHPMSFRWVTKAIDNGAKLIVVDPRLTRSASLAHIYAPMRSGADIAFIGGLINYALENNLYNKEYVVEYTNAAHLINPEFEFSDGLFSGYNSSKGAYDKKTWQYQLDEKGVPKEDKTLRDSQCVFQLMKKHYSRYDPDTVSKITGTPKDVFLEVAKTFCATGAPDKVGTIMYAMGTTQHTVGSQNVRSYAVLQLLLGNIGLAGGGINALRGEPNVQGSTDHCLLFHILPGYLKTPTADNQSLQQYIDKWTPKSNDPLSVNYWKNTPKFIISMLKAWWGEHATKDNDFCYNYLPKLRGHHSHMSVFEEMYAGKIKGTMLWGQNPVVGGPNSNLETKALENLDWLVAVDIWETESSIFWKRPGVDPADIKTEVFLLPAAASVEKEGSITNSGRWMQWRYKAVNPPGMARSDLWILDRLYKKIREIYSDSTEQKDNPILQLHWEYGEGLEPEVHEVAMEINGYDLKTGKLLPSFGALKDDGSTSSGNWLYCASYTEAGNMAARRDASDPSGIGLYSNWAWCWPVNRRIIYNRASCDTKGRPWSEKRKVIWWDKIKQEWLGDVPDYGKTASPEKGIGAFIMKPEGHAGLFGMGMADGPFPEHYEPVESPVKNLMSSQQYNPAIYIYTADLDKFGDAKDFPIICTTYRVTEHWQTGIETRWQPWLCELMPEMFVEMSRGLADSKGIQNGEKCTIVSARGKVTAKAIVTDRFKPFRLNGKMVEQVGLPWCFGYDGLVKGDIANLLTPHVGDANTRIPEYKAFLCDVRKGV